jgi:predicted dehydrogenase
MNRRTFLLSAGALAAVSAARLARAQEKKKFKACIIGDTQNGGYGHSMYYAFALRPDVAVVGLADPDEAGRAKAGAAAGATNLYADYREMLEKEKPDVVAVGPRYTARHKEYVLACAAAGAHGYLEKPIAIDCAEGDEMVAATDAKNLRWAVAYNFRFSPLMAALHKAVVEDQLIGSLLELRARGKEDNRAGGEDLVVLGTHMMDLMRYFAGDALWCSADITQNGEPATAADVRDASEPIGPVVGNRLHAMYGFQKGIAGHFDSMKTKEPGERWGLDLYGNRGIITIRQKVVPTISWLDDASWAPGISGKTWQPVPGLPDFKIEDESRERHKYIVDELLLAIEENRAPAVSLRDSLLAHEMIQAAFQSHFDGKRLPIPLEKRTHPLLGL